MNPSIMETTLKKKQIKIHSRKILNISVLKETLKQK